jgi:hypothetical protein
VTPDFPLEFFVPGTPVSSQSDNPKARSEWKERVKAASSANLDPSFWSTLSQLSVTMYYFPAAPMQGDVDNIVKLVLDGMCQHIYVDDHQVERVAAHRFEPGRIFPFSAPSATLTAAILSEKPVLYVRVSDDPVEDLS